MVKRIQSATFLQKNISTDVKNGLMQLGKLLDRTWIEAEDARQTETAAPPAEYTVNAKRIADSPLHSNQEKKWNENNASDGDFIHSLQGPRKDHR